MIRVLLVDDSALIRTMLKQVFKEDERFELAGEAADGKEAVDKASDGNIDLIIMDINMPVMDGIEATRRIADFSDAAIVMFTTEDTLDNSYKCITAGALELFKKPNLAGMTQDTLREFREKLYLISQTHKQKARPFLRSGGLKAKAEASLGDSGTAAPAPGSAPLPHIPKKDYAMLLIGSSTGGPSAIQTILKQLPEDFPLPIVITQHIDKQFDKQLVKWLDDTTNFAVSLASNGERPEAGHVYIAPADKHLIVSKAGRDYIMELTDDPPMHFLRPSVDKLFFSAAMFLGNRALAVMLTGMGRDGADGAVEIKRTGGFMIAQDEASCIVFGMPKAVIEAGAADAVLPLNDIAPAVSEAVSHIRR